jgi:hypothetical protein
VRFRWTEPKRFTISKAELRALVTFSSKDECRAHLNSVFLDGKAGLIAATDGHRLLFNKFGSQVAGTEASGCLRRAEIEALLGIKTKSFEFVVDEERGGVTVTPFGHFIAFGQNLKFPDIMQVVPNVRGRKHGICSFDPRYLGDLKLCREFSGFCRLHVGEELDPLLVEMANGWKAVLMPRRDEGAVSPWERRDEVDRYRAWAAKSEQNRQLLARATGGYFA